MLKRYICLLIIVKIQYAQLIISSDPYYLIEYERSKFLQTDMVQSLSIRPIIKLSEHPSYILLIRNDIFFVGRKVTLLPVR